jgi:MFS family permease
VKFFFKIIHLDPTNLRHLNAWYLGVEIFWASVLASAAMFNAAFALRLGASSVDIGLLSSLPALLAVLVSLPSGRFLQSKVRRKPWILWSLGLSRAGYLLVAAVPLLSCLHIPRGTLAVAVLIALSIPATFFTVGFIPMLAEVIPERNRAGVFTARNLIYNSAISVLNLLFGLGLTWIDFPSNYSLMYLVGCAASMLSLYYLVKIQVPDSTPVVSRAQSFKAGWRGALYTLNTQPRLARLILNTFLHGSGVWMAMPLYILYYVRQLDASDAWIGLQGTVASLSTILGFILWRRLMARWGEPRTLKRTIVLLGLFPIAVGLSPSLTLILLAVGVNGLIAPGVTLSHFNTLLRVTPEDNRPGYTAWYMAIVNIGVFAGPLLGVVLAGWLGLGWTLVGCGVLSILGSTSFWIWPVQTDV